MPSACRTMIATCGSILITIACVVAGPPPARNTQEAIARVQNQVDFPVVIPCRLPNDLDPLPHTRIVREGVVEVAYNFPTQRRLTAPLRILEQKAQFDRLLRDGERVSINSVEAVVQESSGSVAVEWIVDGVRFQVAGIYSREDTLKVVESMIRGCG